MTTKQEKCPQCNGTGIYMRPTSYTVNGKPVCFRCNGTGVVAVKVAKRRLDRHAKWQIAGPLCEWVPNQDNKPFKVPF